MSTLPPRFARSVRALACLATVALLSGVAACGASDEEGRDPDGDWIGQRQTGELVQVTFAPDSSVTMKITASMDTALRFAKVISGKWSTATGRFADTGLPYRYVLLRVSLDGQRMEWHWPIVRDRIWMLGDQDQAQELVPPQDELQLSPGAWEVKNRGPVPTQQQRHPEPTDPAAEPG